MTDHLCHCPICGAIVEQGARMREHALFHYDDPVSYQTDDEFFYQAIRDALAHAIRCDSVDVHE